MERNNQLRRSKSASSFQELPKVPKYRTVSRALLESGSHVSAGIRNDKKPVEIRQSSSGRGTDRPLANIVAERIQKETEPKRRYLSGLVRLLHPPSLCNAHKQKKRSSDSYGLNNTSTDVEPDRQLYDGQSSRRSPKKEQETYDVYEDLGSPSFADGLCSSRWDTSSQLSKSEMALIQQNLQSNRLTYDETINERILWGSVQLDDTSDMLDSRDLMKQFCRRKKPLGDRVYDQQGTCSSSHGGSPVLLYPPISPKHGNSKSRRADEDVTDKHNITYSPNGDDDLLVGPDYQHRAHRISYIQLKEKEKKNRVPSKNIVLNPQEGDMQNAHGSSPHYSQDYVPGSATMIGHLGAGKELSRRKTKSDEARNLASKITRRLRYACESDDPIYSGLKGYVVDESSYGAKESVTDTELEMFKGSSRNSIFGDNKWGSHPSSRSVNEEAKKRLAERWKITRRYQDLEIVGKGSTLGEVLTMPAKEKRSKQPACECTDRSCTQVGCDNGNSIRHDLLGTICRGGSNNKTERTYRSRSVPPMGEFPRLQLGGLAGGSIRGRGTWYDMLSNKNHLWHSEPISHGTSKVTEKYPSHKDTSQGSKFRDKKPLPCPSIYLEEVDSSSETRFELGMEANVKDLPYQQLMFHMEEKDDCGGSDVPEIVATDHGITTLLSRTSLLDPDHSSVDNESSSSTADDQKNFCHQELMQDVSEKVAPTLNNLEAEPVYPESSNNTAYTSPVAVYKSRFVKNALSSLEIFKRVNAEINDLRLQLQLLNVETGARDNTPSHIPTEEGWESSYILDVLIQAGLEKFGFDLFRIMWHSPDCPLDYRFFIILEEKYNHLMTVSRPERLLLFDRMNYALSEIFLKHIDVRPWAMPHLAALMYLTWKKERLRSSIESLIRQESAYGQVTERMLNREMQWLDQSDEIVLMDEKIEERLIDDLINEFLLDECS